MKFNCILKIILLISNNIYKQNKIELINRIIFKD